MTIQEFFALSAGKWFSQRTTHQLASQKSDHCKSEIVIELLTADAVKEFCPQADWGGIQVVSKPVADWSSPKNTNLTANTTLLAPTAGGELAWVVNGKKNPLGQVSIGSDEALTFTISNDQFSSTERIWFASPNLRLRSVVQETSDGIQLASFCSEIRMRSD
jgi:phycoerythrin-associated linker protein